MDNESNSSGVRRSLPLKIAGISCALLVTAILVLSILNIRSIQTSSFQAAVIMGRNKLTGDIASFQDLLALEHGHISLLNGELVDEHGNSIKSDYDIVDHVSSLLGVHATIFMKEGDDFRRITTSIIDGSGNRAVDTFLGKGSPAYNPLISGNDYFGNAVILGKDYLTAYRPLFAHNSSEIIGILFIGIEMSSINDYITNIRNSTIISVIFQAVIILILAVLITVAVCRIILLKPIRAVMDMLKHLRDGDFTQILTVKSKDELGEMANHINFTVEKVKGIVASLEQHSRLLKTANEAAAVLLENSDVNAFESSLLKCFELIGHCLDADRVQIWSNDILENEPHFILRYEWLSDYGKNCKSIPLGLHFPYSMKKDWYQKFINHEYINSPVCELPAEDQAFLMPYEMKSLIILPMFSEGSFWGFFSIDDCRREHTFSEEEINVLTSAGLMMISAVNRNMQALIAREAEARTQIMIDAAPLCAIFWDKDIKMLDCNQEVVNLFGVSSKQEFIDKFTMFSPDYQSDGILSVEKGPGLVKKSLDEGYSRFEWMHQNLNGELIPAEVICIRVKHRDEYTIVEYIRDLREQKAMIAANEKINEANERTQLMFDSAPFGASFWDEDLNIIDCNNEIVKLFDLSSKQEFIDRFLDFSPECQPDGSNSKEMASIYLNEALNADNSRFEWVHQKLNGEPIPCEVIFIRVMYKGKYSLTAYIRDLREQKAVIAANEKVNEANDRIRSIFDTTPLAITMWDPETFALIDCNLEAVRVVGLTDKNDYLRRFAEMSPEYQSDGQRTAEKLVEIFDKVMKEGYWRYNWEQMDVNGEVIPFQVNTVRLKHMGGYIVIAYAQDMRETNAAIAKMRKTDEFTQVMFKAMPLACQLWNQDLQCVMCNDETIRVYGVADRNYFLDNFFDFSPEYQPDGMLSKEKGHEHIRKGFEDGYFRFDWVHRRGGGEEFPCEITMIRAMFNGEPALLTYTNDLSEEMEVIKERQKAEVADASNKAKSDFLAKMSHEIRTPMNAILGIAEIQLQDEKHRSETKEAFERIYNSGDLLLGIINDILDLSKIEAGKLSLILDRYDIASLIHDTIQLNIMRYETKPINFILDIKEDLPLLFIGDELRIKQILNNILSNSFKYTEEGTVKMTIYAEPADAQDDSKKTLVFIINDTGQGMSPEQMQKLGTEYSRFNMEANRKTEGTGLGMNITRNLIQLMNGTISVESIQGTGSTFTVRLPQICIGPTVIGQEVADNLMRLNLDNSVKIRSFQIKKEFMPYGNVLVVDDVETNLYVAKGLMAPYGLSVETVMSGFEAIDKIKEGSVYDIIFMDHMMPKMDGIETVKIIRDIGYTQPIVALTANAISGQAAMFMENGFDDFISKPIDIRQLNGVLNKLIRDKYPHDVVEAARKQKNDLYFDGDHKKSLDPYLAEIFVRDAKKAVTEMERIYLNKCRSDDDLSSFIINIHAMKSALANVGEMSLSAEAAKLEQAGREKKVRMLLTELPSFMEILHSLISKLEPDENAGSETNASSDNHYLEERLLAVKKACALYYKKIAKDTLAEIRRKTWPQPVNELLNTISTHLLHSEFDEVIQIIDSYVHHL
jgi:signal transduction histidine kinase/CheY-like chemotaxis protein/HPt (histidine-containing phosphotransfer) domain-containing protein